MLKKLRKKCLVASNLGRDGNLQSAFSSMEILYTLYSIIDIDKIKNKNEDRDVFILSKGQSNLAHLSVLDELGFLKQGELENFCKLDSRISMQADYTKFDGGIENSAGSLGHGLPMAVGVAMAKKIKGQGGTVYVLAGDGEMNEGTMWEALLLASKEELDNLFIIIDNNHSMPTVEKLEEKLSKFELCLTTVNGHSVEDLKNEINSPNRTKKPRVLIAETKRGYGSKTLMENKEWFHKYPDDVWLKRLITEVEEFEKNNDRLSF